MQRQPIIWRSALVRVRLWTARATSILASRDSTDASRPLIHCATAACIAAMLTRCHRCTLTDGALRGLTKRSVASPPSRRIGNRRDGVVTKSCEARRHAHSLPEISKHGGAFTGNGIGKLYTPGGFEVAWTQNMGHLLERLNSILAGDAREHWTVKQILLDTARNPSAAATFNYASMLHNNHFYFSGLSPEQTTIPAALREPIERTFTSVDTLRQTLLATAGAMFGPGFVWLVQTTDTSVSHPATASGQVTPGRATVAPTELRILTTYLAGSPYPGAHARQQSRDLNTHNLRSQEDYMRQTTLQNRVGSFGRFANPAASTDGEDARRFGGANVVPLLCVNTWEHAWLPDWGVAGKRAFLDAWWDHVDWDAAAKNLTSLQRDNISRF